MLTPARKITPAPWMTAPETAAVMGALAGEGGPKALFVGGCVRNMLLDRPVDDIDIATIWTPDQVIMKLEAAGLKAIPTGIDHGTVTAVARGKPFEITTLRRDVATDGRRAVVAFTKNWHEDAQRRDFTMNTLLADPTGAVYDPTGQGLVDLEARRVLFVGDPAARIAEDYLRILRFFRFHAFYGAGQPDQDALRACRAAADKIGTLSRERIMQEFFKILSVDDPVEILELMFKNNVMKDSAASGYNPAVMSSFCRLQKKWEVTDITGRLVVLAAFARAHLDGVYSRYFVLSQAQKKNFTALIDAVSSFDSISEKSVKRLIYNHGNDISIQSVLLYAAHGKEDNSALTTLARDWRAPSFPLTGHDVKKAGVKDGPRTGELLRAVEAWWIENDFAPDRVACLKKLQEIC